MAKIIINPFTGTKHIKQIYLDYLESCRIFGMNPFTIIPIFLWYGINDFINDLNLRGKMRKFFSRIF